VAVIRPAIPPITHADRLPHDKAVWRVGGVNDLRREPGHRQISIDYGGLIEETTVTKANWRGAVSWRFGHAPQPVPHNLFDGLGLAAKE
jgi:hypothetical protein